MIRGIFDILKTVLFIPFVILLFIIKWMTSCLIFYISC
jgi:hypothetical protein